jgi:predicted lysophospholipase L1 biosynthesis ABC-type transport system permease subunit
MMRIAVRTLRFHKTGFIASFVAMVLGATILVAAGGILETAIRGDGEEAGDLISLSASFGGLSALVIVFVVAGTLGLSIRQRLQEMALLRAVGATPNQLRRLVVGETMTLAVIATALAYYPGPWLGRLLFGGFKDAGVVPEELPFRSGEIPLYVGLGTAMITALCSAFAAAHGAARTRPVEALAEASVEKRKTSRVRITVGLLSVAGGAMLVWGTATSSAIDAAGVATPAAMVWAGAAGLLGPVLSRWVTRWLRGPMKRLGGFEGYLADQNTRARAANLASAVMPVMLAVGMAVALLYIQTTQPVADGRQEWMAYLVTGVVAGYAVIALVNTQVLATSARRREFTLMRLVGATRRQVLRMMAAEAALVAAVGVVLGLAVAALTVVPMSLSVLGSVVPGGSPWTLVAVVATAFALTMAATLATAGVALRGRVMR